VANTILNPSIIAKAAVALLENELVAAKVVYRGYEDEFDKKVNGYPVGATISIRKPTQFTVRSGATASIQDVVEGVETFTVDQQKGVDFNFTSVELTLQIEELSERVLKPAMIRLANQIDVDVLSLYKGIWNWVGTPGQNIDAFSDFAKGPERLDLQAVPQGMRMGVISPSDKWALAGSQTALALPAIGTPAYRKGALGMVADVDLYMTQNVVTHTTGPRGGTPLVNGAAQNVTYATAKATESVPGTQTLITDGWTAAAATRVAVGDVFTIANVFAVNPVTKATLPYLQQFTVATGSTVASDGSGNLTLTIAPAIITSGAFQTVDSVPADNAALTFVGTASTGYPQNMVFNKEAFGLVIVPMVNPPGAVDVARETYKGISARMIPYYSGSTDVSAFRLDVLYGLKVIDPRQASRISGT
jgi:hypothetical protein